MDGSGSPAENDEPLMLRAARGDDEAFCALVRRHGSALVSFFARSGAEADAEDLAQRTFIKLHGMRSRYAPTAKFTTLLYVVARRVLVDHVRAEHRREDLLNGAAAEAEAVEDAPRTRGESQDAALALAALSPPLRDAVVLVVMQGLAYNEAAEALGVPSGTVKSRIHAALSKMRETLRR